MATANFTVTASAPSGTAVAAFTVVVNPATGSATTTFSVTVNPPTQYLYQWTGSGLIPVRMGRWNGTSIDWLSPSL